MFDIETVAQYPNFEEFKMMDIRGAKLFESKYHKMKWDEKYDSINDAYCDNAGIISTYGKIVCISFGYLDSNGEKQIRSFYGDDERDIVNSFNELLKKIEKKNFNLAGFRILYFDIVWIFRKLIKYGIEPANIICIYDKKPWEIRITDISDDWKGKFAWMNSFDELSYELGLESPKSNLNGSEVHHTYWAGGIERVKDYCEKDVDVSIEISKIIYK